MAGESPRSLGGIPGQDLVKILVCGANFGANHSWTGDYGAKNSLGEDPKFGWGFKLQSTVELIRLGYCCSKNLRGAGNSR